MLSLAPPGMCVKASSLELLDKPGSKRKFIFLCNRRSPMSPTLNPTFEMTLLDPD